ncbi:Arrestin domain-containing protein C31A2.12 [Trametes pubescens]|uniref:Arrestin domain-containing protein C31A2.12 n=1 Tax=Trametes pubescens TaxID=154538 RepID=A0A1M2VIJ5_TRAPU|nr:Arrestin domain-containing protein C31A2.12 [Trametes pubescens]
MSYVLHRSPTPPPPPPEEDALSAALHAALRPFDPTPHTLPPPPEFLPNTQQHHDMPDRKSDKHPHLEIHVASDTLCLRGTGVDVNPALLSGNVVLHLTEPTSIKEITLSFRGKARLPVSAAEPLALSSSQLTYVVCNHEWSFLEGDRHHAHTLKAGRHLFPFQLQIGGSLPSSIYTSALGGASVQYKLRAHAVRGGFGLTHREITANLPVTIMRGFGTEALEYQQTLEIENTWPEKLMYSIMIPHKAWAAGERLTAVVKFQPLVKGARVLSVTTTINETVKLYSRTGSQENTRVIASTKHDIVEGKAVCVDEQQHRFRVPLLHGHSHVSRHSLSSAPSTPALTPGLAQAHHPSNAMSTSYFPPISTSSSTPHSPSHTPLELAPLTTTTTNSSSSSGSAVRSGPQTSPEVSALPSTNASVVDLPPQAGSSTDADEQATDVVTTLNITVPLYATSSHSLEPIQVSHRVRWSILIGNLDGHTSELRCSLPVHVLDHRLADEARVATLATRRLLLEGTDVDGGQAVLTEGDGEDAEALPSYPSHVRDRVANAYLPDSAVMRVANSWVVNGISPTIPDRNGMSAPFSESSSGAQSPAAWETWPVGPGLVRPPRSEHLPHEPQPGATPLEWVNTELLLSLGNEAPEAPPTLPLQRPTPPSRTPPESMQPSRHGSRFPSRRPSRSGSRAHSRANSRAASPERGVSDSSTDGRSTSESGASALSAHSRNSSQETFVHSHSTASRNMHGLFHIAMKPFTSLGSTFSLGSRSSSHANLQALHQQQQHAAASSASSLLHSPGSATGASTPAHGHPEQMTTQQMLHHAFTQVPDYDMASRGFLGGGITPLETLRDLPSYESVAAADIRSGRAGTPGGTGAGGAIGERSFSDGDLASMFSARGAGGGALHSRAHTHHPRSGLSAGLSRMEPRTAVAAPAAAMTP